MFPDTGDTNATCRAISWRAKSFLSKTFCFTFWYPEVLILNGRFMAATSFMSSQEILLPSSSSLGSSLFQTSFLSPAAQHVRWPSFHVHCSDDWLLCFLCCDFSRNQGEALDLWLMTCWSFAPFSNNVERKRDCLLKYLFTEICICKIQFPSVEKPPSDCVKNAKNTANRMICLLIDRKILKVLSRSEKLNIFFFNESLLF